jgi:hypothetical protein
MTAGLEALYSSDSDGHHYAARFGIARSGKHASTTEPDGLWGSARFVHALLGKNSVQAKSTTGSTKPLCSYRPIGAALRRSSTAAKRSDISGRKRPECGLSGCGAPNPRPQKLGAFVSFLVRSVLPNIRGVEAPQVQNRAHPLTRLVVRRLTHLVLFVARSCAADRPLRSPRARRDGGARPLHFPALLVFRP